MSLRYTRNSVSTRRKIPTHRIGDLALYVPYLFIYLLCMWLCVVCLCVCMFPWHEHLWGGCCVQAWAQACGGQSWGVSWCFLHCSPSCMLKQGLTCGPRVSDVTVLVASLHQAPPSPLPECLDYSWQPCPPGTSLSAEDLNSWVPSLLSHLPIHPMDENWMLWIFQNGNSEIQFFSSPQGLLLLLILTIVVYLTSFASGFSNVDILCHLWPLMRLEVSQSAGPYQAIPKPKCPFRLPGIPRELSKDFCGPLISQPFLPNSLFVPTVICQLRQ